MKRIQLISMDIGNALEVTSIVMLNGSEKTDMLWQADAMSLSNVKQFWKQAKRYGTDTPLLTRFSYSEVFYLTPGTNGHQV